MQLVTPATRAAIRARQRRLGMLVVLATGIAAAPDVLIGREPVNVGLRMGYYQQLDNGGIAQIDENGSVYQALILVDVPVTDRDRIHARVMTDIVSSASITRAHNPSYRANQSGASGAVHVDGRLGYTHHFDSWDLSMGASASWDYAYRSIGANLGASFTFLDKTATLRIGASGFFDTLAMIRFNGEDETDQGRQTIGLNLGYSQILSRLTVLDMSVSYTLQSGFLAGQFNSVFLGGVEAAEVLPSMRHRVSATVRLKQGFGERHSIDLGGRYYVDSWGIQAGTVDTGWSVYFDSAKRVLMRLGYRFYLQGPASYYAPEFGGGQNLAFQTSDPDLGGFIGHSGTLKFTFADVFGQGAGDLDIEGNYYHRTSGLDMFWFGLGYRFSI